MTRTICGLLTVAILCAAPALRAQQARPETSKNATNARGCVVVSGAVQSPARLDLVRPLRLTEAIALARGIKENAGQDVQIVHSGLNCLGSVANDQTPAAPVSVDTYSLERVLGNEEKSNPFLLSGDIIIVAEAPPAYVVGNVVNPRAVYLKEPTTLTQLLAKAGGLLPRSRSDRIKLYRQAPGSATRTIITVDLKRIEKCKAQDLVLQPYDVVEIPTNGSFSRSRMLASSDLRQR